MFIPHKLIPSLNCHNYLILAGLNRKWPLNAPNVSNFKELAAPFHFSVEKQYTIWFDISNFKELAAPLHLSAGKLLTIWLKKDQNSRNCLLISSFCCILNQYWRYQYMHITRKHGKPVEKGMIKQVDKIGCHSYSPDVCVCVLKSHSHVLLYKSFFYYKNPRS